MSTTDIVIATDSPPTPPPSPPLFSSTTDIVTTSEAPSAPPPLWNSCRLTYTICAFFAFSNLMFVKLNMSFAFVCMPKRSNETASSDKFYFDWNKQIEGHVLSSYFYGLAMALLIGGWLTQTISPKACFVAGNAVGAVINFLIPASAYTSRWCLYAVRFVQGLAYGIMVPAIQLIFSSWTHVDERTKLISFSYTGYNVGATLVNPISSLFCKSHSKWGWSYMFYFTGTVTVTCAIAYYFLVFDSVHQHPRISTREKDYILSGISTQDEKKPIPYKNIFTSIPVYTYFVVHFCQVFGYAALSTTLPLFFQEALHLGVIQNGFISALPFILSIITRIAIGQWFEPVHRLTKLSLTRFRKMNHVIGTSVPAMIFLSIALMSNYHYKTMIIVLLCLVSCICDLGYCASYIPSLIDISPNFAGFLTGIATSVATLPFVISAEMFGHLGKKNQPAPLETWKVLWYTCSGIYVVGCIVYVAFGTSVQQRWG